jgi:hypothetical protein
LLAFLEMSPAPDGIGPQVATWSRTVSPFCRLGGPRHTDIVATLSPGELLSERNLQSNLALTVRPGEWPRSICRPAHGTAEPTVRQADGSCVVSPLRPLFANAKWRAGSPAPFDQANGGRPRSQVAPTYDAGPTFCFGEGSSIPA